jgi:hypothetical protein
LSDESLLVLLPVESPPLPLIVTPLDVINNIGSGLRSRLVVLPVHTFACEDSEKVLGGGVVGTAAYGAHAADHLMGRQESLIFLRRKLTPPIRV